MAPSFDHQTLAQRIVFRSGGVKGALSIEAERLASRRVMLIASKRDQARALDAASEMPVAVVHDEVTPHVPVESGTKATEIALTSDVDLVVAFGGGSAVGLAKFIARETGLPIVSVPTTYSGSEVTNVWGQTSAGVKTTGIDDRVLPRTIIYDAELTADLPMELTVASAINALAHGIEAMWAPRTDPIARTFAEEGIRALSTALRGLVRDPHDLVARENCLYGSYMSAAGFAAAGSGLHHKICHVLGGRFDLPHAQMHSCVLPHVLAFNVSAAPEASARIARALGAATAVDGLDMLYDTVGAPRALGDFGYTVADIAESVERILPLVPPSNPRAATAGDLTGILASALAGQRPQR